MASIDSPSPLDTSLTRKARRSWFDGNGGAVKFDIAVEKPDKPSAQPEPDEEIEVLQLTHFTKPPRIDFGKLRTGRTKTRQLLVSNPHEYGQQVVSC